MFLIFFPQGRIQQFIKKFTGGTASLQDPRAIIMVVYIISLLTEHCDFDRVRLDHKGSTCHKHLSYENNLKCLVDVTADLNSISEDSVMSHVYSTLLQLYGLYTDPGLRGRLLQCLGKSNINVIIIYVFLNSIHSYKGFLFRAQPTLMTLESSATMMDAIFSSPEEESKGRLLKIMQDFLISESSKHMAQEKGSRSFCFSQIPTLMMS